MILVLWYLCQCIDTGFDTSFIWKKGAILGWNDPPGWMAEPRILEWANDVAKIEWTPPESVPNILEYELELTPGGSETVTGTEKDLSVTVFTQVRIRAKNENGFGNWSELASIYPVPVLPAPEEFSATVDPNDLDPTNLNGDVNLRWKHSDAVHFKYYEVTLTDRIDSRLVQRKELIVPRVTFPLLAWRPYIASVKACNGNLCGDAATTFVQGLYLPYAPGAPYRKPFEQDFVLTWHMPPGEGSHVVVDSYTVYVSDTLMSPRTAYSVQEREWTYDCQHTGLFVVRVSATNQQGEGPIGAPARLFCGAWPVTPVAAPTLVLEENYAVFALPTGPTAWILRWLLQGEIYEKEVIITDRHQNEYRWGPLPWDSRILVRYAIQNEIGTSLFSPRDTLHIAPIPPQIGSPRGLYRTDTTVLLEWQRIYIASWELEITETDGGSVEIKELGSWMVQYEHTCQLPRSVQFRIRGVAVAGKGQWSRPLLWSCKAFIATPPAPQLIEINRSFIRIAWDVPYQYSDVLIGTIVTVTGPGIFQTDGDPPGSIKEVRQSVIINGGIRSQEHFMEDPTVRSYNFTTIPGQIYRMKTRWITTIGDSFNSLELKAYSAIPAKPLIRPIRVAWSTDTEIMLNWTPDEIRDMGGTRLLSFNLYVSTDGTSYSDTPQYTFFDDVTEHRQDCADLVNLGGVDRTTQYLWFRMAAVTSTGEGTLSQARRWRCSALPDTPDPPRLLSRSYDEHTKLGKITITWDEPTLEAAHYAGILAYKIYIEDGALKYYLAETIVDVRRRTFTRDDCIVGKSYGFKLIVTTEIGDSDYTEEIFFSMVIAPEQPSKTYTLLHDDVSLLIGWKYDGHAGGQPITFYQCWYSVDGSHYEKGDYVPIFDGNELLTCGVKCKFWVGLNGIPHSQKNFWIRVTVGTEGFESIPSEAHKQRCSAPPDIPLPPTKVNATLTSVEYEFSPSPDMHGAELEGYQFIYQDMYAKDTEVVVDVHRSFKRVNVTGLQTGKWYNGRVNIISDAGVSTPTGYNFNWLQAGMPETPEIPVCMASQSADLVKIGFHFFNKSTGGVWKDPWYYVYSSTSDLYWPTVTQEYSAAYSIKEDYPHYVHIPCGGIFTNHPDEDGSQLEMKKRWIWFRVIVYDRVVRSGSLPTVPFRCFCGLIPPVAMLLEGQSDTSQVTVYWEQAQLNEAPFIAYHLYINDGYGGTRHLAYSIDREDQLMASIPVPVPGVRYMVELSVESGAGRNWSSYIDVWACDKPKVLPAPRISYLEDPTVIVVSWDFSQDLSGGCPIVGFRVFYDTDGDFIPDDETCEAPVGIDSTLRSCTIYNVDPGTSYNVHVVTYTAKGIGVPSEWAYALQGAAPLQIDTADIVQTRLSTGDVGDSTPTSITISWEAIKGTDIFNGCDGIGFSIYRDDGDESDRITRLDPMVMAPVDVDCDNIWGCAHDTLQKSSEARVATMYNLKRNNQYRIQLAAISECGEGARSDIMTIQTGSMPSPVFKKAPRHVESDISTLRLRFEWDMPTDNGNFIYNYKGEIRRRDDLEFEDDDPEGLPLNRTEVPHFEFNLEKTIDDPFRQTFLDILPGFKDIDDTNFLLEGAQYQLRASAENRKGFGDWSPWSSIVDPPRGYLYSRCRKPVAFQRQSVPFIAGFIPLQWEPIDENSEVGGQVFNSSLISHQIWGRQYINGSFGADETPFVELGEYDSWEDLNFDGYHEKQNPSKFTVKVPFSSMWELKVRCYSKLTGEGTFSDVITTIAGSGIRPVENLRILVETEGLVARWDLPVNDSYLLMEGCTLNVAKDGGTAVDVKVPIWQTYYEIEDANAASVSVICRTSLSENEARAVSYP